MSYRFATLAAVLTAALPDLSLDEVAEDASGFMLMLDEVTDPQNVGAILRSAAAFGSGSLCSFAEAVTNSRAVRKA